MADLRKAGGDKYAQLAVLAYRQTLAAHKLVADVDGTALYFPKENFSNGCIATVDVIYPSAPFALLFSPRLMKAQLQPVMDYARMDRWRFPFAPHDLGTYPQANGQVYGGGERTEENQMPVEESGNMLILLAALARVEGNADYTARYWPQVTKWAEYLSAKGLDPGESAFDRRFRGTPGAQCESLDQGDPGAGRVCAAGRNDGAPAGCGALPQDRGGVRRQVERTGGRWRPLQAGLRQVRHVEPEVQPGVGSTAGAEICSRRRSRARRLRSISRSRISSGCRWTIARDYTKLDWVVWTATMAGNPGDFEKIVAPAWQFANDSASRVPLTDWYDTKTAKQQGFQARSVVGGLFIKMLADPAMWKKYSGR